MCHDGNYELAKLLILQGLPVNEENYLGLTSLHLASHEGHTNIVKLLLDHGATAVVNKGNINGSRPLHFAAHEGHKEIVEILLQHGADINQGNNNQSKPIHLATHENHIDIVKLLIEKGANVNDVNKNGSTPMHLILKEVDLKLYRSYHRKNQYIEYAHYSNKTVHGCPLFCPQECRQVTNDAKDNNNPTKNNIQSGIVISCSTEISDCDKLCTPHQTIAFPNVSGVKGTTATKQKYIDDSQKGLISQFLSELQISPLKLLTPDVLETPSLIKPLAHISATYFMYSETYQEYNHMYPKKKKNTKVSDNEKNISEVLKTLRSCFKHISSFQLFQQGQMKGILATAVEKAFAIKKSHHRISKV
ncbi:unnamed protein product [Mytilus edulis]|uniref:Uncharacterized protein n=1 Tax=Mytilus edulis TaxID=6550 RepID=A0A8S3T2S4_MYTED|nr:unnamed protein product [Mytilus edulis]